MDECQPLVRGRSALCSTPRSSPFNSKLIASAAASWLFPSEKSFAVAVCIQYLAFCVTQVTEQLVCQVVSGTLHHSAAPGMKGTPTRRARRRRRARSGTAGSLGR